MEKLTNEELSYIAGFIDGEGCLAISKRKHKNKFGQWLGYSCHIDLTNTNKEVLNTIKLKLKISSKVYENKLKGNRKLAFRLRLNKRESKQLLTLIKKYLIVKRLQAETFLTFCDNSKDSILRESLYVEMKELNKRGLC